MLLMILRKGEQRLTYEGEFDHRQPREFGRLVRKMAKKMSADAYSRGWLW